MGTYKWPTSWAATIIPLKPPVSSIIATLLTFSNLLFTTQAPPTYANPTVYKMELVSLKLMILKSVLMSVLNWALKKI